MLATGVLHSTSEAATATQRQRGGTACCSTSIPTSRLTLRHQPAAQIWRSCRRPVSHRLVRGLEVFALDAAQPFDFEHRAARALKQSKEPPKIKLTVGILGFGNFGQFMAKRILQHGHDVIATSRTNYQEQADALGVRFYPDADDFCEEHPDVVILASSILSAEPVLRSLPVQRLRRNTLFVDVLSVKVFPKQLMLATLPEEVDILCTHPMFGPDSGKGSWEGLNLMYERVRVGQGQRRQDRCDAFLKIFSDEGCRMVEMTCEEHDVKAASTQFITHTVGRMLGAMQLQPTDIDTKGFQSLLNLVENTTNDSFDLYYGLFLYNQNATEELTRLELAFDDVRRQLFNRLHGKLREQLFHDPKQQPSSSRGAMTQSSSAPGQQQQQGAAIAAAAAAAAVSAAAEQGGKGSAGGNGHSLGGSNGSSAGEAAAEGSPLSAKRTRR